MNNKQEWVDGLQVGDKVAMDIGSFGRIQYSIATITKITPKRRISTSNGRTFNPDGSEYGKKSSAWGSGTYIQPVTPAITERVERSHLLHNIKNTKLEELSLEQLREIKKIIGS
jgi:hypothetical protein